MQPVIDKGASLYCQFAAEGDPCKIANSVDKTAKKEGFSPRVQRHYYEMQLTGSAPSRLQVVYDGGMEEDIPVGHCTLTVVDRTQVSVFHNLVAQFVSPKMVYIGPALMGWKNHA